MKAKSLFIGMLCLLCANIASADKKDEKVIYKWENNGLIYYSHIKPVGITNFTKLDSQGRKIIDFSQEFDEIVEIAVRPDMMKKEKEGEKKLSAADEAVKEVEDQLKEKERQKVYKKNCELARKNVAMINNGEVYKPDASGNMIRLSGDELVKRRAREEKNVNFYCSED